MLPITIRGNGELAVARCTCAAAAGSATVHSGSVPASRVAKLHGAGRRHASYGQILKSSALVGGAQVANIAIGVVRTKAMALLLGPAGFGLFGLYGSIASLAQTIAGMGINSSGVRQIADAVGSGDKVRVAQTTSVLKWTSAVLGLLGGVVLVAFSRPISTLTFGGPERAAAVALLSIVIFLSLVAGGQAALIQGMRRISDLAKMNVLGAFFAVCTSVPLVYVFRETGVVPSLIVVAAMTILTSWWYSRKIEIPRVSIAFSDIPKEASALLKLGSAFMASGLMTVGVAYVVRIIILRRVGFEAIGLYQSAWTLGGLYVGFVLQAMGADFYPRLTASIHDHEECNHLVNEQTLVGLLLAAPGVLATLSFAPLVVTVLYSAKFAGAVAVLRWISLGVMLQVVTWPMGFIIVAKGRPAVFILAELAWTVAAIGFAWIGVKMYGLTGAGIAFFGSYVFHLFLIYPLARWLTGFRWSAENHEKGLVYLALIGIVFGNFYLMPFRWAAGIGTVAAALSCIYSIRVLATLVLLEHMPRPVRRLLLGMGLAKTGSAVATGACE